MFFKLCKFSFEHLFAFSCHTSCNRLSDFSGLVPLHNSASYGHIDVTELLLKSGANVNAVDLWHYTPLHESSAKGRQEVGVNELMMFIFESTVSRCVNV